MLLGSLKPGGMGEAFLALAGDDAASPPCVVKRILEELLDDPVSVKRFMREADVARRLLHRNLVRALAAGAADGEPFIAFEFVEGHDVSEILQRCSAEERRMPVEAVVHLGRELASALAYLHDFDNMGLVHRDVSPPNVRVTYAGAVKLLDFGLAKGATTAQVTRTGVNPGKLAYMAPEQLSDGTLDRRADIHAAGILLWELATGRLIGTTIDAAGQVVLPDGDRARTIDRILRVVPQAPSGFNPAIPAGLDAVVLKAVAKDPRARFQTAGELHAALGAIDGVAVGDGALAALMGFLFNRETEREHRAEAIGAGRALLSAAPASVAAVVRQPRAPTRNWAWLLLAAAFVIAGLVVASSLARSPAQPDETAAARPVVEPTPVAPTLPREVTPTQVAPPLAPAPISVTSVAPRPTDSGRAKARPTAPTPSPTPAAPSAAADELDLARRSFDADDFVAAVEHGQAALAAGRHEAHAVLGATFVKLGRYVEAEREYGEALRRDPDNAAIKRRLEIVRQRAGAAPAPR